MKVEDARLVSLCHCALLLRCILILLLVLLAVFGVGTLIHGLLIKYPPREPVPEVRRGALCAATIQRLRFAPRGRRRMPLEPTMIRTLSCLRTVKWSAILTVAPQVVVTLTGRRCPRDHPLPSPRELGGPVAFGPVANAARLSTAPA